MVNLKISSKIYMVVSIMVLVAVTIGITNNVALTTYRDEVERMNRTSGKALLCQQLNSMIYASVMDSRGIYFSQDAKEVDVYLKPMRESLAEIDQIMAHWQGLVDDEDRGLYQAIVSGKAIFSEGRNKVIALALASGNGANAKAFGVSDAQRDGRKMFSNAVTDAASLYRSQVLAAQTRLEGLAHQTNMFSLWVTILGVTVGMVLMWLVTLTHISGPLTRLIGGMKALAAGDAIGTVPFTHKQDEIGDMARALQVFKDNVAHIEALAIAEADLKKATETERQQALRALADRFDAQVGSIVGAVTQAAQDLQLAAETMTGAVTNSQNRAESVMLAAGKVSQNTATMSLSTEELAASISGIASQVERSRAVSQQAQQATHRSASRIQTLSDGVGGIEDIVSLITSIASQTNLLALNATIEAARAGEAGKGFAVVASEVKILATQTAKATEAISQRIADLRSGTDGAVEAIRSATDVIAGMADITVGIASAVDQQSSATAQIARNVDETARGAQEVSFNMTVVQSDVRASGTIAATVYQSASQLAKQAASLREQVAFFVNGVRQQ